MFLQSDIAFFYKVRQCYYKVRQCYYKVRQILQSATVFQAWKYLLNGHIKQI